jgi:hypothetical protein
MTRQSVGGEHTTPDEEHGAVEFALAPAPRTVCHGREPQAEQRRCFAGTRRELVVAGAWVGNGWGWGAGEYLLGRRRVKLMSYACCQIRKNIHHILN